METGTPGVQRRWTLGGGWAAGLVVAFALLLGIGGVAIGVYLRLINSANQVEHSHEVLRGVERALSSLRDAETGQRGYLLTHRDEYLAPYRSAVARIQERLDTLRQMLADDPEQSRRLRDLSELARQKILELNETIRLAAAGRQDEALARVQTGEGKSLMDSARRIADEMRATELQLQSQRRIALGRLRWMTGGLIGAVVLLGLGLVGSASAANALLRRQRDSLEREIAARKVAQLHLQESREQYRTTLASIGDGVIATDSGGRVRFMNSVAESLTGWAFAEAEMRPIHEIFRIVNEETRAEVPNPVDRVLREGKIVGLANHTLLIGRDGIERPIDDSGAPIRTASDEIAGALLVFRDISERKRFEEARRAMLEVEQRARIELERAGRVKDEFLANLSHELRTPLNAVIGWAHALKSRSLTPDEHARAVESIDRNARLQARLIADLLEMSTIASGRLSVDLSSLDLASVVSAVVDSASPTVQANSLRIKKIIEPAVLPVMGDAARIQQIVWNLVSNALKFTPPGGLVTVAVHRAGTNAEIIVADTGQGISEAFLPHVFERFRQEDSSLRRKHGGLGLGLAIVRQLVEAHGGSVRAESPGEGRGATFIVTLPLCEAGPTQLARQQSDGSRDAPELRDLRVLVVDDDDDGRELLARILRDAGCIVTAANSAEEGIARLANDGPELIISDISMPEVDGYEFLARVRRQEEGRSRRVAAIALTGFAQPEVGQQAALVGYSAHVTKPIDPDEFLGIVAQVISQQRRKVES